MATCCLASNYTRNWQLRFVKDFGPSVSLGLSIENPAQQVYAGFGGIANGGSVNGLIVNFNNPGGQGLGSSGFTNTFTTDTAPEHHWERPHSIRMGALRGGRTSAVLHRQCVLLFGRACRHLPPHDGECR